MKKAMFLIFILSAFNLAAQTASEKLSSIKTMNQACAFIRANPQLEVEYKMISSDIDKSKTDKELFDKNEGETVSIKNVNYKIIEAKTIYSHKVSYIFLDGYKVSVAGIDKLRKQIMDELHQGKAFAELVVKYTMDGNKTGEFGWLDEGSINKDFGKAVREHKKGDIFTVDVPDNKWYYVVLKTDDSKVRKEYGILKVKE